MKKEVMKSRYLVVIAIFACVPAYSQVPRPAKPDKVEITVGGVPITVQDILYEVSVDSCYGDTTVTKESAAAELVNKKLEQVVIKQAYKQEPPLAALEGKAAWMRKTTRDSARLACHRRVWLVAAKGTHL